MFGEFDDQDRVRIAADRGADDGLKHRDLAAECDHGTVDKFDRYGAQFHEMLGRVHRLVKTAEMADAQHLVADDGPQFELDLGGEGKRAFGADQKMRHIVRRFAGRKRIEIVAADTALHLWKFVGDLGRLALAERQHVAKQIGRVVVCIGAREVARNLAEMQHRAVRQHRVHRERVVAHGAVAERTSAAGIVAGHAADGGAGSGGDIDRKPQAVLLELTVEVVEHDAGFDDATAVLDVEREDAVEVLGEIDDDAVIDGLAALRRAAAAGGDGSTVLPRNGERPQRLVDGFRDDHAKRHDLVERRVGGVAAAAIAVEQDLAGDLARQPVFDHH